MAKASAILALLIGGAFAALAALQVKWGFVPWVLFATVAMLVAPAVLTLMKREIGLRLLIAAWGVFIGAFLNMFDGPPPPTPNSYSVDETTALLVIAVPGVAVVGLLLALFHKQR